MKIILLLTLGLLGCKSGKNKAEDTFLTDQIPQNTPIAFKPDIVPENKLIHKGIFSPDLQKYYYTISDRQFEKFDVFVIKNENGQWSEPEKAFFNSQYSEHGMSFSTDGNTLFFSSTRPTNIDGVSQTWHIWQSEKINGKFTEPRFVDIPNLRHQLVSHPTMTTSGMLYFHSSNLDYSEMDIYQSKQLKSKFGDAAKSLISMDSKMDKCTPFVSPNGEFLIFASIGNQLDLMISYHDGNGGWINTKKLTAEINNAGQGNPYVTPDNKFLFFTTGSHLANDWKVKWVNIAAEVNHFE